MSRKIRGIRDSIPPGYILGRTGQGGNGPVGLIKITDLVNKTIAAASGSGTNLPAIANNDLLANTSGAAAPPSDTTLTALIDAAIGATQGNILYRNSTVWTVLAPGTINYILQTGGPAANPSWVAPVVGANPTATGGPAAVNGTAATFMRSDAAPAIQKASAAQFGLVEVDGTTITAAAGVISAVQPTGANPTATAKDTAVNGSATTFMRSDAAPAIQKASSSQFGIVEVDGTTITASGGVISSTGGAANPVTAASVLTASALTQGDDGVRGIKTLANAAAGQVLASGTPPGYTATPTLTSITFGSGTALSDYEEGTWTPTDNSGAGLTFTVSTCIYTKIGNVICVSGLITWPVTANGASANVAGLPFGPASSRIMFSYGLNGSMAIGISGTNTSFTLGTAGGAGVTNANMSTLTLYLDIIYT